MISDSLVITLYDDNNKDSMIFEIIYSTVQYKKIKKIKIQKISTLFIYLADLLHLRIIDYN